MSRMGESLLISNIAIVATNSNLPGPAIRRYAGIKASVGTTTDCNRN